MQQINLSTKFYNDTERTSASSMHHQHIALCPDVTKLNFDEVGELLQRVAVKRRLKVSFGIFEKFHGVFKA